MTIQDIIDTLNAWAHPALQEPYDNSGLQYGIPSAACRGILVCLDVTPQIIDEAIERNCNLIIAHHPLLFKPLKQITGSGNVDECLIKAIRNDIAIFAFHTNLDNVITGVSRFLIENFDIEPRSLEILSTQTGKLAKIYTYVPSEHAEILKTKLFEAGCGQIGQYEQCSFETMGKGQFKPQAGADPFIGEAGGKLEKVEELKIEAVFPLYKSHEITRALLNAHPYETPAYEIIQLQNVWQETGSGILAELKSPVSEEKFLAEILAKLNPHGIRYSPLLGKPIKKIAVCGGSGAFLISRAKQAGANLFITGDLKYHDFFEADGKLVLVDAGHFETERFAVPSIMNFLKSKFPNFAVLETSLNTNPVRYLRQK